MRNHSTSKIWTYLKNKTSLKRKKNLKGTGRICSKSHEKNCFSIFCFYLVEMSLRFQNMCRLCIYDSPFHCQGLSNMENNQIQYIDILIVFTIYLMLEFVQICRPYTFLIALSLLFNTNYDSILLILVGSNFNHIFLKNHRFSSLFSLWTCATLIRTFSVLNKRFSVYLQFLKVWSFRWKVSLSRKFRSCRNIL